MCDLQRFKVKCIRIMEQPYKSDKFTCWPPKSPSLHLPGIQANVQFICHAAFWPHFASSTSQKCQTRKYKVWYKLGGNPSRSRISSRSLAADRETYGLEPPRISQSVTMGGIRSVRTSPADDIPHCPHRFQCHPDIPWNYQLHQISH